MIASNTEHERQAVLADLRPQQLAVRRQLATLARRIRSYLVCQSLACVLGISAAVCFATLALDWLFRPALATRMSLAIPMAIVIFVFAIRRLSRPLRMRLDDLDLANLLDRHQPGLGQRVANVLQLPELLGSRLDSSTSLIRSAVINDVSVIKNVPFDSLLDRRRLVQALLIITASIALPLAFYFASPAMSQLWIKRWLLAQTIRWPQQTYLSIVGLDEGNRILVPRNEPLLLRVEAQKPFARHGDQWHLTGRGELLSLRQQEQPSSQSPDEVTLRYQSTSGEKQQAVFNRISPSRFHYELPAVTENVELTISADESWRGPEDWIGPIHVVPIDRPTVDRLTLTVQSPLLKTPEVFTYEQGDWQQLFLPETKFKLEIRSRVALESASLSIKTGTPPLLIRQDDRSYIAEWTMAEAMLLELQLVSKIGGLKSKPYFLPIGLLKDRAPRVALRHSGVGRRVTATARIPITVRATDDFVLTSLGIDIQQLSIQEEKTQQRESRLIATPDGYDPEKTPESELEHQTSLSLASLGATVPSVIRLRASAVDNCAAGQQTGQSRWIAFQVVSRDELFYEILMRQRAQRRVFEQAVKSAEKTIGQTGQHS